MAIDVSSPPARRTFLQTILAAISGTAVVDTSADASTTDAQKIVSSIRIHGEEAVAKTICECMQDGVFSPTEMKRRLNRQQRRERRQAERAKRRERHVGDAVIYSGPVAMDDATLSQIMRICDDKRSRVSHHAVYVCTSDRDYWIGDHHVPKWSRILIDARRGTARQMVCEIVQTDRGGTRVHIWRPGGPPKAESPLPQMSSAPAGRAIEFGQPRTIGLLGLPLKENA